MISARGWEARFKGDDGEIDRDLTMRVVAWDGDGNALVVDEDSGALRVANQYTNFADLEDDPNDIPRHVIPGGGWLVEMRGRCGQPNWTAPVVAWLIGEDGMGEACVLDRPDMTSVSPASDLIDYHDLPGIARIFHSDGHGPAGLDGEGLEMFSVLHEMPSWCGQCSGDDVSHGQYRTGADGQPCHTCNPAVKYRFALAEYRARRAVALKEAIGRMREAEDAEK